MLSVEGEKGWVEIGRCKYINQNDAIAELENLEAAHVLNAAAQM